MVSNSMEILALSIIMGVCCSASAQLDYDGCLKTKGKLPWPWPRGLTVHVTPNLTCISITYRDGQKSVS